MIRNTQTKNTSTRKFVTTLIGLSVALSLTACDGDDGAQGPQGEQGEMGTPGNDGQPGTPGFAAAQFLISNNGPDNAGTVDLVDQNAAKLKTLSSGNNEGIALDPLNNLVHAGDATTGSLRFLCGIGQRAEDNAFNTIEDREITGANTGLVNPKGIDIAHSAGLVLVADFNGMRISVFGSAAAGDVAPLAETLTDAKPWDLDYDEVNDRLFVALTDGTIAVYDDYVSGGFAAMPARVITPSDDTQSTISVNIHGIVYDRETNKLVVSDVGDAASATDGTIFVIDNAASADGNVSVARSISGPLTLLGNPVDIVLSGTDLRVAEKSNDAILVFSNIFSGSSGDIAPTLTTSSIKPESLVQVTEANNNADASDIATTNISFNGIAVSGNPAAGADTFGMIAKFNTSLNTQLSGYDYSQSIESVAFDIAGDAYATFDDPDTGTAGILVGNRVAKSRDTESFDTARDRVIAGENTGLVTPKGLDVASNSGLLFVAENNATTPGILVFSLCASGDAAPVLTLNLADNARPWDVDYDASTDRAYVALTNGTVAVFDEVTARMNSGMTTLTAQDRTIIPAVGGTALLAPSNIHGIDFDPASGNLILSDVGSAADATDGKLYVLSAADSADGLTEIQVNIGGANSNLGNPVDIMYSGSDLFVAEKSNNVIMRFDNILASEGGDIAANATISFNAPESVALIPHYISE
ncbi:NHL repeat containing protein [Glaciecola sp. 4H-3-7+YE-5]|nr:NHL repeat containing protein [Glaciecola sp. 4H-3-7+YE-5]